MIPLALAASLTVAVETLDWSKASDDLRFGLLKPVMTESEVRRLTVGKEPGRRGCGTATSVNGTTVPYCGVSYGYSLAGGKGATIISDLHGPAGKQETEYELDPRGGWQWRDGNIQPAVRPKPSPYWTLARFQVVGGPVYTGNKEGLYLVQSK